MYPTTTRLTVLLEVSRVPQGPAFIGGSLTGCMPLVTLWPFCFKVSCVKVILLDHAAHVVVCILLKVSPRRMILFRGIIDPHGHILADGKGGLTLFCVGPDPGNSSSQCLAQCLLWKPEHRFGAVRTSYHPCLFLLGANVGRSCGVGNRTVGEKRG